MNLRGEISLKLLPGVYQAFKKDGSIYYRSSITHRNKHISLGSYATEIMAHYAYIEATDILLNGKFDIDDFATDSKDLCSLENVSLNDKINKGKEFVSKRYLSFHKWVVLMNYRDNGIYFKNPIYLKNKYFEYYLDTNLVLKFDVDDLFYYSHHKIMKRGGHLFVSDYGMQVTILSRYGVKNFAVVGRDYRFVNGDDTDYRYTNIEIINKYYGVTKVIVKGKPIYVAKIHINGDYIVGKYSTEAEAAIAYNKAAKILNNKGFKKDFPRNYITEVDEIEYARLLNMVKISRKIREYKIQ